MILETAFTIEAPAGKVFAALLDLEALAACLPGASLEPVSGDATLQGALRPTVGGAARDCVGTLRAVDADEDGRSASAALQAREVAGPGFATALLRGKVTEADGGSRVELAVDGRVAAPGVSEDDARPEAERLLGELAASLEPSLAERAAKVPEPAPEPEPEAPPLAAAAESARRALPVPVGAALGTAAAAGAAVLAVLLRRRPRRGAWVEIRYRW
jgi:uncharacterized protein